ncbi:nuclear transport factor 2 family protein [Euhalothece natronophila Z-M001]|uniref:Nuclear transport factor 2 family protein n=1 Tax=Euhalothece natronophila Z-M001 TaxID=522448 RepID=A0A5B8NPJ5_9CHRO|nr:nuclear transport factor 2 family protein [Euhalothece natronophila]QDZ41253.1 nuclear transport factor 2 family protein [Euhalothece natronophila Z-M001]
MVNTFFQQLSKWSLVGTIALFFPFITPLEKPAWANSPDDAPKNLTQFLDEFETAANEQNLEAVTNAYSSDFNTQEGLSGQDLTEKLQQLWETYSQVNYEVELESWEEDGDDLIAETVTHIRGERQARGQQVELEAQLRSRQRINNDQITSQETLSESSQVFMGENAPRVRVNAPNQVGVGERFNFDVIVREPMGDDILMGTAMQEEVTASNYLNPQTLDLDVLPGGGIFRTGEASSSPGQRWLSAVIVRSDGMTLVSQRMNIVAETSEL